MRLLIIILLLTVSNMLFAQNTDKNFSITISSADALTFESYNFTIIKDKNEVSFKYSLFDSLQLRSMKKDTLVRRLNIEVAENYKDTSKKHDERLNQLFKAFEKYNVYDNDSVSFNLKSYPGYHKLLDSVYTGTLFKIHQVSMLDGVAYSIKVKSETVSRKFQTISPDENSNPTLYHLIRDTFIIYNKLSKNPLVYHKHIYNKK